MNKSVLLAAFLVFAATAVLPTATAEPQCLQVYPWSKLCQGDVDGFLCAYGVCFSAGPEVQCLQVYPWSELCEGDVNGFLCANRVCVDEPTVDCIQAIPWSYLCSGNVRAFVNYWLDLAAPVEPGACVLEGQCFDISPPVYCLHGVEPCDPGWD